MWGTKERGSASVPCPQRPAALPWQLLQPWDGMGEGRPREKGCNRSPGPNVPTSEKPGRRGLGVKSDQPPWGSVQCASNPAFLLVFQVGSSLVCGGKKHFPNLINSDPLSISKCPISSICFCLKMEKWLVPAAGSRWEGTRPGNASHAAGGESPGPPVHGPPSRPGRASRGRPQGAFCTLTLWFRVIPAVTAYLAFPTKPRWSLHPRAASRGGGAWKPCRLSLLRSTPSSHLQTAPSPLLSQPRGARWHRGVEVCTRSSWWTLGWMGVGNWRHPCHSHLLSACSIPSTCQGPGLPFHQ